MRHVSYFNSLVYQEVSLNPKTKDNDLQWKFNVHVSYEWLTLQGSQAQHTDGIILEQNQSHIMVNHKNSWPRNSILKYLLNLKRKATTSKGLDRPLNSIGPELLHLMSSLKEVLKVMVTAQINTSVNYLPNQM